MCERWLRKSSKCYGNKKGAAKYELHRESFLTGSTEYKKYVKMFGENQF